MNLWVNTDGPRANALEVYKGFYMGYKTDKASAEHVTDRDLGKMRGPIPIEVTYAYQKGKWVFKTGNVYFTNHFAGGSGDFTEPLKEPINSWFKSRLMVVFVDFPVD